MVVDLGRGADGGERRAARELLLERDGRRHAVEAVHVRPGQRPDELPHVGRQAVEEAALALGEQHVEGERRLAGARDAGHGHQGVPRDLDRDLLQVVLARADDAGSSGDLRRRAARRAAGRHARALRPRRAGGRRATAPRPADASASASALPVGVSRRAIASGGPSPTTRPPASPASGPRSTIQSAAPRQRQVVLDHDHRVAGVDEPLQRADQHRDVGRVQAGGRLVEQVEPVLAAAGLGQRLGELQPLRLAARERRRRLRQREVAEAEVEQRLERGGDAAVIAEEPRHLGGGQVERVGDREAAAADLQHLGTEAPAVAGAAAHEGVRQELQLDLLVAGALADRAGAGRGVEREGGRLEPALLGLGRRGEDLAQRLEHTHVGRGVDARAGAERGLVDERDAGERVGAVDPVAGAGLGLADAEVPAQVPEQHLVDERRLAGARDAGHADEPPERQLDASRPSGCSLARRGCAGARPARVDGARRAGREPAPTALVPTGTRPSRDRGSRAQAGDRPCVDDARRPACPGPGPRSIT